MNYRNLLTLGALALLAAAGLSAQNKAVWKMPRTGDGKPDLQGIWTNATLTPMERPASLAGKATLTDAEAAAYVRKTLRPPKNRMAPPMVL